MNGYLRGTLCLTFIVALVAVPLVAQAVQTDVVLVLDLSGSMKKNDPDGHRFTGAAQLLALVGSYDERNRAAAVSVGDRERLVLPFQTVSIDATPRHSETLRALASEEWTELGLGLRLAAETLRPSQAGRRAIVLLSDGILEGNPAARNVGRDDATRLAARDMWDTIVPRLAAERIKIYTLGLFQDPNPHGERTLQTLSTRTGGFYVRVRNPAEFRDVFKRILDDIDPSANVWTIDGGQTDVPVGPTDDRLVVRGRGRVNIVGPDGTVYGPGHTPQSGVRQQAVAFADGMTIVSLVPVDDTIRAGKSWSGSFHVDASGGIAEINVISRIRNVEWVQPPRPMYFLNETLVLRARVRLAPTAGQTPAGLLSWLTLEYTLIDVDSGKGTVSGTFKRNGEVFEARHPLKHPANYFLDVRAKTGNHTRKVLSHTPQVTDYPVLLVEVPSPPWKTGQSLSLQPRINERILGADNPSLKGFRNQELRITTRYGSEEPVSLAAVKGDDIARPVSLKLAKCGPLQITADLAGDLVIRDAARAGADPEYQPFEATSTKNLEVADCECAFFWCGFQAWLGWMVGGVVTALLFGASSLATYLQIIDRLEKLRGATLRGLPAIDPTRIRPPFRIFLAQDTAATGRGAVLHALRHRGAAVTLTAGDLPGAPSGTSFRIGAGLWSRDYYIKNDGTTPLGLKLARVELGPAESHELTIGEQISMGEVTVTFQATGADEDSSEDPDDTWLNRIRAFLSWRAR